MMQNRGKRAVRQTGGQKLPGCGTGASWAHSKGFYMILTDEPGKDTWPISGATFILMHKTQKDPETAKRVLDFFTWAYQSGGKRQTN